MDYCGLMPEGLLERRFQSLLSFKINDHILSPSLTDEGSVCQNQSHAFNSIYLITSSLLLYHFQETVSSLALTEKVLLESLPSGISALLYLHCIQCKLTYILVNILFGFHLIHQLSHLLQNVMLKNSTLSLKYLNKPLFKLIQGKHDEKIQRKYMLNDPRSLFSFNFSTLFFEQVRNFQIKLCHILAFSSFSLFYPMINRPGKNVQCTS